MTGENRFRIEHVFCLSFKAKERRVTYKGEESILDRDFVCSFYSGGIFYKGVTSLQKYLAEKHLD